MAAIKKLYIEIADLLADGLVCLSGSRRGICIKLTPRRLKVPTSETLLHYPSMQLLQSAEPRLLLLQKERKEKVRGTKDKEARPPPPSCYWIGAGGLSRLPGMISHSFQAFDHTDYHATWATTPRLSSSPRNIVQVSHPGVTQTRCCHRQHKLSCAPVSAPDMRRFLDTDNHAAAL